VGGAGGEPPGGVADRRREKRITTTTPRAISPRARTPTTASSHPATPTVASSSGVAAAADPASVDVAGAGDAAGDAVGLSLGLGDALTPPVTSICSWTGNSADEAFAPLYCSDSSRTYQRPDSLASTAGTTAVGEIGRLPSSPCGRSESPQQPSSGSTWR
jgi:hypothetical protein